MSSFVISSSTSLLWYCLWLLFLLFFRWVSIIIYINNFPVILFVYSFFSSYIQCVTPLFHGTWLKHLIDDIVESLIYGCWHSNFLGHTFTELAIPLEFVSSTAGVQLRMTLLLNNCYQRSIQFQLLNSIVACAKYVHDFRAI